MSREILVLSGPNLSMLGSRDPAVYGTTTLAEHIDRVTEAAHAYGFQVRHVQSESEAELIRAIHAARTTSEAIIINAGALTHTSWSLSDALDIFDGPVIEVHLSHPQAREPFRHTSTVARAATGSIAGFGALSYDLAIEAVVRLLG